MIIDLINILIWLGFLALAAAIGLGIIWLAIWLEWD